MKITTFEVNGMQQALGIDDTSPVFHFTADSGRADERIEAYRLTVTDENSAIAEDTGKVKYKGKNSVSYGGKPLLPKTAYRAELQIWSAQDTVSETGSAVFETGFLGTEWQAGWIEPEQENAIPEKELSFQEMIIPNPGFWGGEARLRECKRVREEFRIGKEIKKARIYASAHGVYNLYVNGKKASDRRLAPENSAYEKILYYQTYDVTGQLKEGVNAIGAILGDGWWIGRLGMAGYSCNYGDRLGLILQMEVVYADGTKEIFCMDEQAKSGGSYIAYSDLSIGEKQDLNKQDDSWMQPGFSDDGWSACKFAECAKENLTGQPLDGIRVTEELPVKEIVITPKRDLVLDFGQVIAGVCRIRLRGTAGGEVTLEHGEVLDAKGNYINNILGRNKDQKDVLICRDGEQVFEPQFTYHGFRYVRITGLSKEQILEAKAMVMGTPIRKLGSFSCSDERLNRLQHNIEWSTRGNMFSIPTDCPQREKLGWTGDIQVYAKTGCFNYDLSNFLGAWLTNLRAEQSEDGEVPVVAPNPPTQERTQRIMSGGSNSSAAWGDACILVPYYLYQCYGEKRVLRDNFSAMEKWLSYIKESCELKPEGYANFTEGQKARNPYLWTKQYHFGDWLIPSLRALPDGVQRGTEETAAVVGSCFYAISVSCFIEVCKALGKNKLASEYAELLTKIKKAVRDEFIEADGTVYHSNLQGLYVMVLKAEITAGGLKEKILDKLVCLIKENDYCLDTGFASVPYLLDVLYENGRADVAYRLLFQTKAPGWLYMVENGATTIWENWLAVLENGTPTESSYNHYAFGCVGDFIYRHIGGIAAAKPGYREIIFAPDFDCGLTESSCELKTPYGTAALHWKREEDRYVAEGAVPVGVRAVFRTGTETVELGSGPFTRYIPGGKTIPGGKNVPGEKNVPGGKDPGNKKVRKVQKKV